MSKSVKSNRSYRNKDRRLFNKEVQKTNNNQKVKFEKKLTAEELMEFSKNFKKEHNRYKRKTLLITIIICLLIFGTLGYLMSN